MTLLIRRFQSAAAGQILVVVAVMMVVLIGMTALAIDVGAAYVAERWQRSVADAAALAGAQSLQIPNSRAIPVEGSVEVLQARENAMRILEDQLGGSPADPPACYTSAGCELSGSPYSVSVQWPSPTCLDCQPGRAVQVSIWQEEFGLAFGRIFGATEWNIRSTSVAGMVVTPHYGLVTLRPSALRPNLSDANADDLVVNSSRVIVGNSDIATNSNAKCSGAASGAEIRVNTLAGYDIHHYGAGAAWVSGSGKCANPPPGFQVTTLVQDPAYTFPTRTGAPTFAEVADGKALDADCAAQQLLVPAEYRELATNLQINDPTAVTVECYKPGIYPKQLIVKDNASGPPDVVLLMPGVYFFDGGVEVSSTLIGGYISGQPGVTLVFREANTPLGQFTTKTNTSLVALNMGNLYCPGSTCATDPSRKWAAPAQGFDGTAVRTPEPRATLLTVMVARDPNCTVVSPPLAACQENQNKTLNLQGGGSIWLAGVQYAPSDNAVLTGSSGQASDVGAFWAWTLTFNGDTEFHLKAANTQSAGVLRIDRACSPTEICNP